MTILFRIARRILLLYLDRKKQAELIRLTINYLMKNAQQSFETRRMLYDKYIKWYPVEYTHETQRVYGFYHLIRATADIEGDVVECGVGRGRTINLLCHAVSFFKLKKAVLGFDSFEGFPEVHENDLGPRVLTTGKAEGWIDCDPDLILACYNRDSDTPGDFSLYKESKPELRLIKGFFKDTLPRTLPEKISFLHLDADLYESTYDALRYCLPRMSSGAIIIFDELHEVEKWPGVQKAFSELLEPAGYEKQWFEEVQRFGIIIKK